MDEQRFDDLARRLAGSRSRRSVLRGLFATLLAGAGGAALARPAVADSEPDSDRDDDQGRGCKRAGKTCKDDGQCCSGLICWDGASCQPGCRIGGVQVTPGTLDPANVCQACAPASVTEAWTPTIYGSPCDDGDACTGTDICNGAAVCTGTLLVPAITCPGPQQAIAGAGACGAAAMFSATSDCGSVSCDHASGETFPVGSTTVTCTASNAAGSTACQFAVTVTDETAPDISCPSTVDQAATGPEGAAVNFTVSATDNCTPVTITCSPVSGTLFPIGTTQVSCTATDPSGRQDTCAFPVSITCTPDCTGKNCGDSDGCGGLCFGPCPDLGPCAHATCNSETNSCDVTYEPRGMTCPNTQCFKIGYCDGAGVCVQEPPRDCASEAGPCEEAIGCDPDTGCLFRQLPEGTICETGTNACFPYRCTADGSCQEDRVECEGECQTCDPDTGTCIAIRELELCEGNTGFCMGGSCQSPCRDQCPREWCYADLGSDGELDGYFCCPESARMANGNCCWTAGSAGIVQNNGTTCTNPRRVCAGGVICADECCGSDDDGFAGVCPGANQYCGSGTELIDAGQVCTTDADCGGWGVCAEFEIQFNDEGDPFPVPNSGVCCPYGYVSGVDTTDGPAIPMCCSPGSRPPQGSGGSEGQCCRFPSYTSACIDCDCSFKTISRCCF